jgi:hypothetical protein
LHLFNPLNAFPGSDAIRLAEEIKGKLSAHLNGLQGLSAHTVKDILNCFHVAVFGFLNEGPDDVLAAREAVFCPILKKPCERLPHPVVERADFGGYTTPVDARIALLEGPAWPTPSLGCYWLFCANLFHALKYTSCRHEQSNGKDLGQHIKAFAHSRRPIDVFSTDTASTNAWRSYRGGAGTVKFVSSVENNKIEDKFRNAIWTALEAHVDHVCKHQASVCS